MKLNVFKNKLSTAPDYLFYLCVFILPFNLRHIFNFSDIQEIEGFREHISWSLYAFDLFFILLIVSFIFTKPSSFAYKNLLTKRSFAFIALFIFIAVSAFLSDNQNVAFYNGARIFEAIIFSLIAKKLLDIKSTFKNTGIVVFLSGIFQSFLALVQFIIQSSIGLKLLGESLISPSILGVAKIELSGEKFIRAYGTFPHPNLLAAFLLFSLCAGLFLFKKHSSSIYRNYIMVGMLMNGLGIFLTFSRSVWLATFIFFAVSFYWFKDKIAWPPKKYSSLAQILLLLVALVSFYNFISSRLCIKQCPNDKAYELRTLYNRAAIGIIILEPVFGVGPGNFVPALGTYPVAPINEKYTFPSVFLAPWEMQPAHNLYLLIASETGIIGCVLLLIFISTVVAKDMFSKGNIFALGFVLFLFLGLFDHYFWTLVQGQLLWGLSLAFLADSSRIKDIL